MTDYYENLIDRLREGAEFLELGLPGVPHNSFAKMCRNAADAIEELSKPRWISVEDKLPENAGKYLVCGKWRKTPVKYWICEFSMVGPVYGWINNVNNPCVHYWMPLPEAQEEVEK